MEYQLEYPASWNENHSIKKWFSSIKTLRQYVRRNEHIKQYNILVNNKKMCFVNGALCSVDEVLEKIKSLHERKYTFFEGPEPS